MRRVASQNRRQLFRNLADLGATDRGVLANEMKAYIKATGEDLGRPAQREAIRELKQMRNLHRAYQGGGTAALGGRGVSRASQLARGGQRVLRRPPITMVNILRNLVRR